VSGQLHLPAALLRGKEPPDAHWIGGWVDPSAGLDDVKRRFLTLLGLELRTLGRPVLSQSLYRLRNPGSLVRLSPLGTSATNWLIVPPRTIDAECGAVEK
jgi:hypothetical protein